jgi:hypothetical protein
MSLEKILSKTPLAPKHDSKQIADGNNLRNGFALAMQGIQMHTQRIIRTQSEFSICQLNINESKEILLMFSGVKIAQDFSIIPKGVCAVHAAEPEQIS